MAIYARTRQEEQAILGLISDKLAPWLASRSTEMEMRIVIVSACVDQESFPINELRYHAVACANTEVVFYVDVDFICQLDN